MKYLPVLGISALLASIATQVHSSGFLVNDIGCKQFSYQINKCVQCSNRYYMNGQNICQPVNTNCREYNAKTGACTSCYDGFLQVEDTCLPKFIFQKFDFNCNKFENGQCVKCSKGYFFDENKKCKKLDSNCSNHNQTTGQCLACYPGYQLLNKTCVRQSLDPGCKTYTNGICQQCSYGYYFTNQSGKSVCQKIDEKCKTFNSASQICTQCYQGFTLIDKKCEVETVQLSDPNCREWKNGVCSQCSKGAFFNNAGKCETVDPQCKQFDYINIRCLECYTGFKLGDNGKCIQDTSSKNLDPYCKNWKNGICQQCSFGAYKDFTGKCKIIDATCKRFNFGNHQCEECYPGYQLTLEKGCKQVERKLDDPKYRLCKQWNKQQTMCILCSSGAYFNKQKECVQIDPFCKDFDLTSEACKQCYPGYKVHNKKCIIKSKQDVDLYCVKFASPQQSQCLECAERFFVGPSGKCQEVNILCKFFNKISGDCSSCYSGYTIQNGKCVVDKIIASDPNCKNWIDGICTQCSKGSYLAKNGRCQSIDPQCKRFDQIAARCMQCYSGFTIELERCVQDKKFINRDPFCSQFKDNICVKCSHGYYFNDQKKCIQTNVQCATVNLKNGKCLSCFSGYRLTQNQDCVKQDKEVSDVFCSKFDKQGNCIECSKGFYFNKLRKCSAIDPICKIFDQGIQGCVECYSGFTLKNLKCVVDEAALKQSRCAEWKNGVCVKCIDRSYMGPSGKCIEVSIACKTYDQQNGRCKSCYSGYTLNAGSGECETANLIQGCAEINVNGECIKCSQGYYLSQSTNSCSQIDPDCADFDFTTFQCRGCYAGYSLVGKKCILNKVDQDKKILNCAKYDGAGICVQCFDRFYLLKEGRGECKDVSFFCKTYNKNTGACNTCYTGFKLQGTECVSE